MQARLPYIDRIWRAGSSIELPASISAGEVFDRLDPLFREQGTSVAVDGNTLTYAKTNPAAQDKLATFTSGTLTVAEEEQPARLSYDVGSTALFLCFLAPLAFLAFGQLSVFLNDVEKPALIAEMAEKEAEKANQAENAIELHWVDKMLGAPQPKQPGEENEAKNERRGDARARTEDEPEGNHSPETAYAFAGIFAAIYIVGRVLEPYLLKKTFRNALSLAQATDNEDING
ncbi:MAG: hypothetical protein AAF251_02005 [Pseudomonadota bacterium]